MTEFVIQLLRLRGDERWGEWGDRWWEHAEILGELPDSLGGWHLIDHFREQGRRGRRLDWGALLYPVTSEELVALHPEAAELEPREASGSGPTRLSDLAADESYGLVVIER